MENKGYSQLRSWTSHKLNARWVRSIIKPTQEKRACHEVKIQPKEIEHLAQACIQEEAKMQSNMDEVC